MKLPFDLKKLETLDTEHYKFAVLGLLGVIALMTLSGLIAFFLSLHGAEQTMVPNVRGMELTGAIIVLQEKELYPRLSVRSTNDPKTRGKILEQDPRAGTIVKAGRRVSLVVGKIVGDKVESYIGQNIEDIKLRLQAQFSAVLPLVSIKDPPEYLFNKAPAGTILEQKPLPGTDINGPMELVFIVSRGPDAAKLKVPGIIGMDIERALKELEGSGVIFTFSLRPAAGKERPGTIVSQLPAAGSLVAPTQALAIVYATPLAEEGMVSGLLQQTFPEYPYPLKVTITLKKPDGQIAPLATVMHPGGPFTLPYNVPDGTLITITVLGRDVLKLEAKKPLAP